MTYEKARIKLLDKNTGQVLKEVDPYTSADAVDYDGASTVKDKIADLISYKAQNITDITNMKAKDATFASQISAIQAKDATQDGTLSSLQTSVNVINNSISDLEDYNTTQDNDLTLLQNSVYSKTDADSRYYTKTQIDTNIYTKSQADSNYYTKTAADGRYYTKTQIDGTVSTINNTIASTNNTTTTNLTNQIVAKGNNYAVTTGSNTAYTVSIPGISSYSDGLTIVVLPHADCGGSPTIRINSLNYLQIKNLDGDLLSSGDLKANIPIILVRVGNYFFIRASKRAGGIIDKPDITPGSGTLITSIENVVSKDDAYEEVVRIVNSETVIYRTTGNKLYSLNLRRNIATLVATDVNGTGPMKLWINKYYIYGTRIYDLKFNIIKDFPVHADADHYDKVTANHHTYQINYSRSRLNSHFLIDYNDPTKLYFIEYVQYPTPVLYYVYRNYSSTYSDEFWGEKFYIRVTKIYTDLDALAHDFITELDTWDDSKAVAIKDEYIYIHEKCQTTDSTSNYAHFTRIDMTNHSSIVRRYQYQVRERNGPATDFNAMRVKGFGSQEAERLIKIETEQYHSSSRSDTDKTYHYVYDIENDSEIYTFYSPYSETRPIYAFGIPNWGGGFLTNNPLLWTSNDRGGYLDGIDPNSGGFVQTSIGYYGNLTSKYRLIMSSRYERTGTYPNFVYIYHNHVEIYKL